MIEKVYIHKGEDKMVKDKIRKICADQKVPIDEADFENYLWMCSVWGYHSILCCRERKVTDILKDGYEN